MTPKPITAADDASFEDCLRLLREKKIRRLPIVNKDGWLVGIVVEKDLLYASPSPATTLSVFEVHYLLSKLRMRDVMTKRVITVGEDCPLEEAARIMVDHKIGSLPVLQDGKLTGIITETDIFKTFVEMLGGREKGLRLTLDVTEARGVIAAIAEQICRENGNILSLATFHGKKAGERIITVKVTDAPRDALIKGLEEAGLKVLQAVDVAEGGYVPRIVDERTQPFAQV
jgi:acetoin utilization protein AcuB